MSDHMVETGYIPLGCFGTFKANIISHGFIVKMDLSLIKLSPKLCIVHKARLCRVFCVWYEGRKTSVNYR